MIDAFYSRKFLTHEINYKFHNKELIAIVNSLQKWCQMLDKASLPVIVYTDYKNFEHFMTCQVLCGYQSCWSMSLSHFPSVITLYWAEVSIAMQQFVMVCKLHVNCTSLIALAHFTMQEC